MTDLEQEKRRTKRVNQFEADRKAQSPTEEQFAFALVEINRSCEIGDVDGRFHFQCLAFEIVHFVVL